MLVPYNGINYPIREVIVMGAGVLLLDAAMILAFAPRSLGEVRSAVAALPLVVLAIVPSALTRPPLPYLHGMVLFALLAALMWGERVRRLGSVAAVGVVITAGLAGMLAAPGLDPRSPWLNFQALAGSLAPGHGESFDWSQRYGPLKWPRTGHEVLDDSSAVSPTTGRHRTSTGSTGGWAAVARPTPWSDLGRRSELAHALDSDDPRHAARDEHQRRDRRGAAAASPYRRRAAPRVEHREPGWPPSTLGPGDSYVVKVYTPAPEPSPAGRGRRGYDMPAS